MFSDITGPFLLAVKNETMVIVGYLGVAKR